MATAPQSLEPIHVRARDGSSVETCGFVLHLLCIAIAALYMMWALLSEETLHSWDITYYPDQSWAIYIPTSLLCAFVAAPILYAALNILSTPSVDSIDTVWDDHSRAPPIRIDEKNLISAFGGNENDATIPEICDIDVGIINRYMDLRASEEAKANKTS